MIFWIIVVAAVVATAGTVMIRAVAVTIIIIVIKIPPAIVADAHVDRAVFGNLVLYLVLIFIIVSLFFDIKSYWGIINIIGSLPAFVHSGTTGESG